MSNPAVTVLLILQYLLSDNFHLIALGGRTGLQQQHTHGLVAHVKLINLRSCDWSTRCVSIK